MRLSTAKRDLTPSPETSRVGLGRRTPRRRRQVVVDAVLPPVAALLLLGWAVPPHGRDFE